MTPAQKKEVERYLVGKGVVKGGAAQYGGFLGLVASIGIPLAIDLAKKILGKGLQTQPPRPTPTSKGKRNANVTPTFLRNVG